MGEANGRVYDPLTAMFFSPDPFLQAPEQWLNYNRYGYVINNPMIFTDPSGYQHATPQERESYELFTEYYPTPYWEGRYTGGGSGGGGYSLWGGFVYARSQGWAGNWGDFLTLAGQYGQNGSITLHNYRNVTTVTYVNNTLVDFAITSIVTKSYNVNIGGGEYGTNTGGTTWTRNTLIELGFIQGSVSVATDTRMFIEMTYVNELRLDRARTGNFSNPINHKLRSIKNAGKVLKSAGGVLIGADILMSGELKVSQGINIVLLGISGTGVGAFVGGVWFFADYGIMGINLLLSNGNNSDGLGDMIDNAVGTYEMYDGLY